VKRARATAEVPGPVSEVEALWHDPRRWPAWIEGFGAIARREGEWPHPGAVVVWDSKPAGRGRVRERVVAHEPGAEHAVAVEDNQLVGRQRIAFTPLGDRVDVELSLEYALKGEAPWLPVADVLFIRRALRDSLRRTLARFARERVGDHELATH
jgi:Polyketide cyclase / dehydrase and lipid transport